MYSEALTLRLLLENDQIPIGQLEQAYLELYRAEIDQPDGEAKIRDLE